MLTNMVAMIAMIERGCIKLFLALNGGNVVGVFAHFAQSFTKTMCLRKTGWSRYGWPLGLFSLSGGEEWKRLEVAILMNY